MATRGVYVVHCLNGLTLEVVVGGKRIPMDDFVKEYTPVQVTGLTTYNPNASLETIGLMIAEEIPAKRAPMTYDRARPATS